MGISAADVKALRDKTGAGMMDCKKALVEADGNIEKAIELLRKKGQKLSAKRADREANEGVVIAQVSECGKKGIVIKLSCETDFVSKNEEFVAFAQKIADSAISLFSATKEELLASDFGGITLGDKITEYVGVIGEKVELANYETIEGELVVPYIHMGYRAGVVVALNKAGDDVVDAGKNVAMQVAAMKPIALDKDGIDASVIEKEIEIGMEQARRDGKPEAMLERIAQGKLGKFYKENTLLNQVYVKNNKQNIAQYLQSVGKDLTATGFKHVKLV